VDDPVGRSGGFLRRAAERARTAADALRDEYRKGKEGDTSPVQSIAPSAIDVIKAWMTRDDTNGDEAGEHTTPESPGTAAATAGGPSEEAGAGDDDAQAAAQVASLLGKVNWHRVSDAVRDNAATQRMRELAGEVDWAAAKPVAARVASVLIAAAAAGELGGLQGATGRYVAKTIANEMGLAEKVAQRLREQRTPQSAPLMGYIDTTATPSEPQGFDAQLAELGRLEAGDGS
jgi:hypothetical protein